MHTFSFLFLSFFLGLFGLSLLGYRTNLHEPSIENTKDFVAPTWKASNAYFLSLMKELYTNLGLLTVIVMVVFSCIGFIFFFLSLTPYPLLKKFRTWDEVRAAIIEENEV